MVVTRRGGVGQELSDSWLGEWPGRGGVDRPDSDPWLAAELPGNLHRPARSDPQRVCESQRREARAVQRRLRGRLSNLQRRRRDLHGPRDDGRRHDGLRGVRGPAVPGVGAGTLGGLNIAEVLGLSVEDAVEIFGPGAPNILEAKAHTPAAHAILQRMADIGLGYLRLGQPLTTLSGGERQRLKLATTWVKKAASMDPRRARLPGCTWPTSSATARAVGPAGRLRQVGHRDRAPPIGDGARRLDHRLRAGRGPRRRAGGVRRHASRPGGGEVDATGDHLAAFVGSRPKAVPSHRVG